jgi:hypothetical protein
MTVGILFKREEKEVHLLLSNLIVKASLEAFRKSAAKHRNCAVDEIPYEPTETCLRLQKVQQDFNSGQLSCSEAKRIASRYEHLL